jgi:protein angel
VYKKRTHEKVDGCATFFNEKKFAVDIVVPVEYFNSEVRVLDRDNVGLVVLLKPLLHYIYARPKNRPPCKQETVETRLCVANTHLLFNPRRGDVKLAQLCILLAEIDKVAAKSDLSGYHPVILSGDFNICPRSPLYDFIVGKGLILQQFSGQDLSEQEESQRGKNIALLPNSLPPRVGIFDQCQYIKEVTRRYCVRKKLAEEKEKLASGSGNYKAEKAGSSSMACSGMSNAICNSLGTGVISNNLNLVSVYGHETFCDGKMYPAITTKHGRSECAVDFVFYSADRKLPGIDHDSDMKSKHLVEGAKLKLVTKLDLFTQKEARNIGGFPNKFYPSDHIFLMADFRLCF